MGIKKRRLYINGVAIDVYHDRNMDFSSPKHAVIILSGFPDLLGATAMTSLQTDIGNIVFQPHIMGTYDSKGEFSPLGMKETMIALNEIINKSVASDKPFSPQKQMPWTIDYTILIGHSFGGMMTLRFFNYIEHLKKIIMTSPAVHYGNQYGCLEVGPEHYNNVRESYPYTYRLASEDKWNGILEGTDILPLNTIGAVESVDIFYGENDKYFDITKVQENIKTIITSYIQTDSYQLHIVPQSGHPIAEILSDNDTFKYIVDICRK